MPVECFIIYASVDLGRPEILVPEKFSEGMDGHVSASDAEFEAFVASEQARGTNFVTIVGGEPSLVLERLRTMYGVFRLSVATNGLRHIPHDGFEELPIGVSVWGDRETDRRLRGGGKRDVFERALANYRDDPRAFFYYTVAPGLADEVEAVVARCVDNGNRVLFNFYGDLEQRGGDLGYSQGFGAVRDAIDQVIERYPEHILMSSSLVDVVTTGELFGQSWGHAVCTSITADHSINRERIQNGNPFNPHFRSYNADLATTRRCCTGVDRSCASLTNQTSVGNLLNNSRGESGLDWPCDNMGRASLTRYTLKGSIPSTPINPSFCK